MKKIFFSILFAGISICLQSQIHTSGDSSPEACIKTYMELRAMGKYEESDKWMIKFAEQKPNDLRAKDFILYRPELKNLLIDNGNYTIVRLNYFKSLKVKNQIERANVNKKSTTVAFNKRFPMRHPYRTSNGKTIYFDSDMPGGFGQSDLYKVSKLEDGSWGKPQNLGDKVNTEGDELYPYYQEEGRILFFSSNGRYGLGGLDIFIYAINFSGFGKVYNAGYPLNSRFDDFSLTVDNRVKKGYFKSKRSHAKGDGDLYSVTFH